MVTHDARLIEATECRLWIVDEQEVTPWQGELEEDALPRTACTTVFLCGRNEGRHKGRDYVTPFSTAQNKNASTALALEWFTPKVNYFRAKNGLP